MRGGTAERDPGLAAAAQAALECLGVGPEDDVVVLSNPAQHAVATALATAAAAAARGVQLVEYPAGERDGQEPPEAVEVALADATVVIAPTTTSLSHTRARLEATARGTRIATMPGVTEETFARALPVDYAKLRDVGERIAAALTAATECRITSAAGTDIVLSLEGRAGQADDGNLQGRGAFGNLPAGEAYVAPVETRGDGTIVFDGSLAGFGLLSGPVRVTVADGRAVAADGPAGRWLLDTLDAGGESGRVIAELGIGTNAAARLSGRILEDEKVVGTAHIAFGTNVSLGGANVSNVHIDGLLRRPTIELDGRPLVRDGTLVIPAP
jgi:leucyl aminopeptidase (aminopeptidase T)